MVGHTAAASALNINYSNEGYYSGSSFICCYYADKLHTLWNSNQRNFRTMLRSEQKARCGDCPRFCVHCKRNLIEIRLKHYRVQLT